MFVSEFLHFVETKNFRLPFFAFCFLFLADVGFAWSSFNRCRRFFGLLCWWLDFWGCWLRLFIFNLLNFR